MSPFEIVMWELVVIFGWAAIVMTVCGLGSVLIAILSVVLMIVGVGVNPKKTTESSEKTTTESTESSASSR